MGTKGRWQRSKSISEDEWASNYANIFSKKDQPQPQPHDSSNDTQRETGGASEGSCPDTG